MKLMRLAALLAALALVGVAGPAFAAASNGITVAPAIQQITLAQGQQEASFTVAITNTMTRSIVVAVNAEDFSYLGQNGSIRFMDPPSSSTVTEHGLAAQMEIGRPMLTIAAGATEQVPVTVVKASTLAAGGHYAALMYRVADSSPPDGANIGVQPAVATLVFVSTAGKGTQELHISPGITGGLQVGLSQQVDIVFANTGNTQSTVRGLVKMYGPGNALVQQGIINIDSGLILPGAKRLFPVNLQPPASHLLLPGRYHLTVLYRHDGQAQYNQYDESFWLVPAPVLVFVAVVITAGFAVAVRRLSPARYYRAKTVQR